MTNREYRYLNFMKYWLFQYKLFWLMKHCWARKIINIKSWNKLQHLGSNIPWPFRKILDWNNYYIKTGFRLYIIQTIAKGKLAHFLRFFSFFLFFLSSSLTYQTISCSSSWLVIPFIALWGTYCTSCESAAGSEMWPLPLQMNCLAWGKPSFWSGDLSRFCIWSWFHYTM